jgi:putative transposase
MPRRPRLELPGVPLHVTQRGVNRAATFLDDDDRHLYCRLLHESLAAHEVALHAYVLMTNHVHLLVTASISGAFSTAMSALGRRYVPIFNRKHGRSGTLWEGRFKSCLVQSERYLMTVYRYIELNPVRAAMVPAPEDHRWSSVHANLDLAQDHLVTPHPVYFALGTNRAERASAYREWLQAGLSTENLHAIRRHLQQERALGSPRFQSMVERTLNRPAACRPRGRPRKMGSSHNDPASLAD